MFKIEKILNQNPSYYDGYHKFAVYEGDQEIALVKMRIWYEVPSIYSLQVDTDLASYKAVQSFVEDYFDIQGS